MVRVKRKEVNGHQQKLRITHYELRILLSTFSLLPASEASELPPT